MGAGFEREGREGTRPPPGKGWKLISFDSMRLSAFVDGQEIAILLYTVLHSSTKVEPSPPVQDLDLKEEETRSSSSFLLPSFPTFSSCSRARYPLEIRRKLTDVGSSGGPRVYCDDDSSLEPESERCSSVVDLDLAVGIRVVVGVQAEEGGGLQRGETTQKIQRMPITKNAPDSLRTTGEGGVKRRGRKLEGR